MEKPSENLCAVIIAGGAGERFWPRSRAGRPKQFLSFWGGKTMLEATADRLKPAVPPERIFICTGRDFSGKVRELCPDIPAENIIAEPCGRNTAAAAGYSALKVRKAYGDAVAAVLPADHVIGSEELFRDALLKAAAAAATGSLVVFGIQPDRPATGYGYVKAGAAVEKLPGAYRVEKFLEKPGAGTAERFLKEGTYYWNSGMFVWRCGVVLEEISAFIPELYRGLMRIEESPESLDELYGLLPETSIDFGVMEKTRRAVMIKGGFGWSDIGSWDALEKVFPVDGSGNAVLAENFIALDSSGNVAVSDGRLIAAVGVDNLVIAVDGDAVLVCRKDRAQDVKKLVAELKKSGRLKKFAR